jgi:hypothetical protein
MDRPRCSVLEQQARNCREWLPGGASGIDESHSIKVIALLQVTPSIDTDLAGRVLFRPPNSATLQRLPGFALTPCWLPERTSRQSDSQSVTFMWSGTGTMLPSRLAVQQDS